MKVRLQFALARLDFRLDDAVELMKLPLGRPIGEAGAHGDPT